MRKPDAWMWEEAGWRKVPITEHVGFKGQPDNAKPLYALRPNERIVTVEQLQRWQGLIHPRSAPLPPAAIGEITALINGAEQ